MLVPLIKRMIKDRKIAREFAQAKGHMLANNRNNPQAVEAAWPVYLDFAQIKYKITKEDIERIKQKIDDRLVESTINMILASKADALEQSRRDSSKEYILYKQKFQTLDYKLTCISPENAHPLHKEGVPIFTQALIDLIDAWADAINTSPRRGLFDDFSKIDTIELICIPRFKQFELEVSYEELMPKNDGSADLCRQTIHLREDDIEKKTGKKIVAPSRDLAAKYMEQAEQRMDLPCRGPEDLAHILLIAAADALLSEEVIEKFISSGVRAISHPAHREKSIKFIIKDFDSSDSMNYCEFISAQKSYIYFSTLTQKSLA